MIIDTHAHFTPQAMLDSLAKNISRFPSVELFVEDKQYRLSFAGGALTRPISPKLRDTEQRLQWMNDKHIDCQITGGWLDSFGYELPAQEGAAWSRFMNEHLLCGTNHTSRLAALATVPLQSGKLAAKVLKEALESGFSGAMIGTQPHGNSGNLDDPDLDLFWETASDLKALIYLHPMFGCGDPRLLDYDMMNAVGRGVDTTTAVARLLFSGHFLRYSGMQFILSHGGAGLPFLLGRLARNHAIHTDQYADPVAGFTTLYFDSVLFDPRALQFLCSLAGTDKIMLGSDYPFPIGDPDPCQIVYAAELDAESTKHILGTTAKTLFALNNVAR